MLNYKNPQADASLSAIALAKADGVFVPSGAPAPQAIYKAHSRQRNKMTGSKLFIIYNLELIISFSVSSVSLW